jgi:hypothetical protein
VNQFYIIDDGRLDIQRCNESRRSQEPTVLMARAIAGSFETFKGVVQSVEHDPKHPQPGTGVSPCAIYDQAEATRPARRTTPFSDWHCCPHHSNSSRLFNLIERYG